MLQVKSLHSLFYVGRDVTSKVTIVLVLVLQAEMRAAVFLAMEEQDKLEVTVHVPLVLNHINVLYMIAIHYMNPSVL